MQRQKENNVTVLQAASILVSTIIGVGVLPLPLFAVRAANSGAPLVTLLGVLLTLLASILIAVLGKRYPQQTLIQYSEHILGRWLAAAGSLLIIVFFAVLTSLTAREFGEVILTSVLKNTPLEITVLIMLLLAGLATRAGMSEFAYMHYFYMPLMLIPGLVIVALSLKNAETLNLQPFWGIEPSLPKMGQGVLTVAALCQASFIMSAVIPSMNKPEKALAASLWGTGIAGGFYVIIVVATVSVFGSEEILNLLWPTLELAKTTSLPANILERLDAAFLFVWVTAVFTTLLSSYFLTVYSLAQLLRLKEHRMFSFFLLPVVFMIALVPHNILHMYAIVEAVGRIGLCITIGYPALLLVISLLRRQRGKAS